MVKSYSFMDEAPWQEIDAHEGIENTLIILGHKLRNVTVTRDFDRTLPRLYAYGGELDQVWTNLVDNATYASGGRVASTCARVATASFFSLRSRTMAVESRPRPGRTSFRCPSSQPRAAQARDLAWLCHRIVVEWHHGRIDFSTGPNGTQFNVRLPFESPTHA